MPPRIEDLKSKLSAVRKQAADQHREDRLREINDDISALEADQRATANE